jgi:alpha-L-fucosidase
MKKYKTNALFLALSIGATITLYSQDKNKTVSAEHGMISNAEEKSPAGTHSRHPDAQWYPDAALGLFIHWGLSSVKDLDASWPMIPGRALANKLLDSLELIRVVREKDYNLNGKPPLITPNEYWAMAKDFNPSHYDPDKWIRAAKAAGFTYAVITTKHHEGFAMWPSNHGNFSTKNFMGGRDLIKPFIDACRKYGLKVGLYYSPPDWYFDQDYMNFLYYRGPQKNPGLPVLDGDLIPRTTKRSAEEIKQHQAAFAAYVKGQVEEIMTRWGKIDLLWFDGRPPIPDGANAITQDEIRKLQPGIVINPRMHGKGDFITFERTPPAKDPGDVWAEFCNPWTSSWANSHTRPFRSNAFILGQFVSARAWGVNYLLGVGPKSDGSMPDAVYTNMKVVEDWMKVHAAAIRAKQLPADETASVPATAAGNIRYLFVIPAFKEKGTTDQDMLPLKDLTLVLKTTGKPRSVSMVGSGKKLSFRYEGNEVLADLPAAMRTQLVDVVKVEL